MNKKNSFWLGFLITILGLVFYKNRKTILKKTPTEIGKAILELEKSRSAIVGLSGDTKKFVTRNEDGTNEIEKIMNWEGWELNSKYGSAYVFKNKKGEEGVVIRKEILRFYSVWDIRL